MQQANLANVLHYYPMDQHNSLVNLLDCLVLFAGNCHINFIFPINYINVIS
jgi:hypothetical protein